MVFPFDSKLYPQYDVKGRRFNMYEQALLFAQVRAMNDGGTWIVSEKIDPEAVWTFKDAANELPDVD